VITEVVHSGYSYSIIILPIQINDRIRVMLGSQLTKDFGWVQQLEPTRAPHELVASKPSIGILQRQQGVNRIKQTVIRNEGRREPVLVSSPEDGQLKRTYSSWFCKYKTDLSPSPVQSLTVYPCSLVLNGHAPFVRCRFDTSKCFGFSRI